MPEHSFQEVMRQLNRMCKAHPKCEGEGNDCPLHELGCCGNIGTYCSEPLQVERIEKTVMQWAEENPEPVYPCWIDWLVDVGLIINTANHYEFNFLAAVDRIPASIAEKLGLEPKEIKNEIN